MCHCNQLCINLVLTVCGQTHAVTLIAKLKVAVASEEVIILVSGACCYHHITPVLATLYWVRQRVTFKTVVCWCGSVWQISENISNVGPSFDSLYWHCNY